MVDASCGIAHITAMPCVSTPASAFVERRRRFLARFSEPAVFGSGLARIRNFEANRFPFRSESHFLYFVGRSIEGALLCFRDQKATLYCPSPDPAEALWHGPRPTLEQLSSELQLEVQPIGEFEPPEEVSTIAPDDTESAFWLEDLLERRVEPGSASEPNEEDAELCETMIELRLRHDVAAIEQIRTAVAATCRAHRAGMLATRVDGSALDVRAAMESEIMRSGMSPAYGSIVTPHGDILHHGSSDTVLGAGDLVLADVGAESKEGWASDVTRTWPVSGRFLGLQRDVYDAVLKAQLAAIELVKPGTSFRDVHRAAARSLVAALVEVGLFRGDPDELLQDGISSIFFPHGVGHLLGLDVHDMEDLGDRAGYETGRHRSAHGAERHLRLDRMLEPGMVVTIEPGLYCIDGILDDPAQADSLAKHCQGRVLETLRSEVRGIRIEDDVLVTDEGCEVLSRDCIKRPDDIEGLLAQRG